MYRNGPNTLKVQFIFCESFSDNPGQNYVDTCAKIRTRRLFMKKYLPPLPPNNVGAMIHISWCLFNMVGHNIVKGVRGMKEMIVRFAFKYENLVK